jgi:hypothetical protein
MSQIPQDAVISSTDRSLAGSFYFLGWTGFWLQVVLGSLPVIGMGYFFMFSRSTTPRSGVFFVEYLTIANLLMLVFTAFWSYRYTRLARQLADPQRRPPQSQVRGIVWTGVTAATIAMLLSMLVILIEAASLLLYYLKTPQAGVPVIQTSGTEAVHVVSAVDIVSLMALILTLFSEMIVLVFSLWLLYRATPGPAEVPQTSSPESATAPVA